MLKEGDNSQLLARFHQPHCSKLVECRLTVRTCGSAADRDSGIWQELRGPYASPQPASNSRSGNRRVVSSVLTLHPMTPRSSSDLCMIITMDGEDPATESLRKQRTKDECDAAQVLHASARVCIRGLPQASFHQDQLVGSKYKYEYCDPGMRKICP